MGKHPSEMGVGNRRDTQRLRITGFDDANPVSQYDFHRVQILVDGGERIASMAETTCFCAALSHDHAGDRCGHPVKFCVETQTYQGKGKYGPLRMIGICEECWERIQKELPGFFGDDQ
jgi:hypothetical protein